MKSQSQFAKRLLILCLVGLAIVQWISSQPLPHLIERLFQKWRAYHETEVVQLYDSGPQHVALDCLRRNRISEYAVMPGWLAVDKTVNLQTLVVRAWPIRRKLQASVLVGLESDFTYLCRPAEILCRKGGVFVARCRS